MRPRVFVGSSEEGLRVAVEIERQLRGDADVDLWNNHQVFPPGSLTLAALESCANKYDFALIVMAPDDLTLSRGKAEAAPRDNLVFELGLFMGKIGPKRTLIIQSDAPSMKLPSDLRGLVVCYYKSDAVARNVSKAAESACQRVRERIEKLGLAASASAAAVGGAAREMAHLLEKTKGILATFQESQSRPPWFESVAFAKPALLEKALSYAAAGEAIRIDWLGMTMFNVWNTLPGFLHDLAQSKSKPKSVALRVAMLSHDWLAQHRINSDWKPQSADERYASINKFFDNLRNDGETNWTVEIERYSHMPAVHGGLINDKCLLLGLCQWDRHDDLKAGDMPYELFTLNDCNRGKDRIDLFKGWFQMCWKSAQNPAAFRW